MNFRLCLVFFVLNTGFVACSPQKTETAVLHIERSDSVSVTITVEIARTEEERSKGLMYREQLLDGEGMIFVFDYDQPVSFWMKNTLIPLSIAFITADGRILEIKDMYPLNLDSVHSSRPIRYALETPQGWFNRVGIIAGDMVNLRGLSK
jgi:uncharacterized membrane protein (UPF0127 family)